MRVSRLVLKDNRLRIDADIGEESACNPRLIRSAGDDDWQVRAMATQGRNGRQPLTRAGEKVDAAQIRQFSRAGRTTEDDGALDLIDVICGRLYAVLERPG